MNAESITRKYEAEHCLAIEGGEGVISQSSFSRLYFSVTTIPLESLTNAQQHQNTVPEALGLSLHSPSPLSFTFALALIFAVLFFPFRFLLFSHLPFCLLHFPPLSFIPLPPLNIHPDELRSECLVKTEMRLTGFESENFGIIELTSHPRPWESPTKNQSVILERNQSVIIPDGGGGGGAAMPLSNVLV